VPWARVSGVLRDPPLLLPGLLVANNIPTMAETPLGTAGCCVLVCDAQRGQAETGLKWLLSSRVEPDTALGARRG